MDSVGVRVDASVEFFVRVARVRAELFHVGLGASLALHGQGLVEPGRLVSNFKHGWGICDQPFQLIYMRGCLW
jgi:hypothetical protein